LYSIALHCHGVLGLLGIWVCRVSANGYPTFGMLYRIGLGSSTRTTPTIRFYSKTDDASLRNVVVCITRNQHSYTARLSHGDTRYAHGCCYFHTLHIVRRTSLALPALLSPASWALWLRDRSFDLCHQATSPAKPLPRTRGQGSARSQQLAPEIVRHSTPCTAPIFAARTPPFFEICSAIRGGAIVVLSSMQRRRHRRQPSRCI
jgi:hypothetical protein